MVFYYHSIFPLCDTFLSATIINSRTIQETVGRGRKAASFAIGPFLCQIVGPFELGRRHGFDNRSKLFIAHLGSICICEKIGQVRAAVVTLKV